jgi:hypothetical protein
MREGNEKKRHEHGKKRHRYSTDDYAGQKFRK